MRDISKDLKSCFSTNLACSPSQPVCPEMWLGDLQLCGQVRSGVLQSMPQGPAQFYSSPRPSVSKKLSSGKIPPSETCYLGILDRWAGSSL